MDEERECFEDLFTNALDFANTRFAVASGRNNETISKLSPPQQLRAPHTRPPMVSHASAFNDLHSRSLIQEHQNRPSVSVSEVVHVKRRQPRRPSAIGFPISESSASNLVELELDQLLQEDSFPRDPPKAHPGPTRNLQIDVEESLAELGDLSFTLDLDEKNDDITDTYDVDESDLVALNNPTDEPPSAGSTTFIGITRRLHGDSSAALIVQALRMEAAFRPDDALHFYRQACVLLSGVLSSSTAFLLDT
jgi:hypothetical protein